MIQEGNIYESADPRDNGRRIRVVTWNRFDQKALIESHPKGDRRRYVQASSLHDTPLTGKGERRRTGYFRVTSSPLEDRARQPMDPETHATLLKTLAAEEPLTGRARN